MKIMENSRRAEIAMLIDNEDNGGERVKLKPKVRRLLNYAFFIRNTNRRLCIRMAGWCVRASLRRPTVDLQRANSQQHARPCRNFFNKLMRAGGVTACHWARSRSGLCEIFFSLSTNFYKS